MCTHFIPIKKGKQIKMRQKLPYNTVGADICIRAVDQQHIGPSRGILRDSSVEGWGGENWDVIIHVIHQNCYCSCSAQRRRTWRQMMKEIIISNNSSSLFLQLTHSKRTEGEIASTAKTEVTHHTFHSHDWPEHFLTDRIRSYFLCYSKMVEGTQ